MLNKVETAKLLAMGVGAFVLSRSADKQTIAQNVKLALRNVGVDTKVITIKKDEIIIKGELCEENTDNVAFDFWKETGEDIYTDQDGEPITKEMDIERIPSISFA